MNKREALEFLYKTSMECYHLLWYLFEKVDTPHRADLYNLPHNIERAKWALEPGIVEPEQLSLPLEGVSDV